MIYLHYRVYMDSLHSHIIKEKLQHRFMNQADALASGCAGQLLVECQESNVCFPKLLRCPDNPGVCPLLGTLSLARQHNSCQ